MKILFLSLIACTLLGLYSCDKNDDGQAGANTQIQSALLAKYPGAINVKWQSKNGYSVAHFNLQANRAAVNAIEHTAWFDNGAKWHMTEIDILYTDLPQAVQAAFQGSEYATWRIDDVDMLERADVETVYVIEVEGVANGIETDVDLYYSPDGILVKSIVDADTDEDYSDYIPSPSTGNIETFIKTNYPNARIVDIDREDGMTEVEIIDNVICRELLFDSSENWISTITELHRNDLPAAVVAAVSASIYASYHFDDIEHVKTASNEFYVIELEKGEHEVTIRITPDGNIL